ncbi:hypothetical protein Tdes44962_MAKER10397 [Teratosphaeria destructans]|uniref:Uncharacterized protein n=1 Tax=Teratosphaeria destructans TaxID=418781 RepID=A0A9W7VYC8_9PEZI|nr:hypothetical protein Tdes44962_MAKER10397 [Teratosphaeria destructans]
MPLVIPGLQSRDPAPSQAQNQSQTTTTDEWQDILTGKTLGDRSDETVGIIPPPFYLPSTSLGHVLMCLPKTDLRQERFTAGS